MSRLTRSYAALFAILSACGSAYADRVPIQAHRPATGSYSVNLVDEYGRILPTFNHRGRFYILGNEGQRYSVRITNSTPRRVEAVISIDGLDAVDGRTADFQNKRGYVVPAYGSLQVDGFRVSMDDVATFRFSNVPNSYAGRKGQARHVGVVGVAIFSERYQEPVYLPQPEPYYDYEREAPVDRSEDAAPSPAPPRANGAKRPAPAPTTSAEGGGSPGSVAPRECYNCGRDESYRPGLGTEFGERRGSRVSYVGFVRANHSRPDTVVELRYNDRDGLIALGIPLSRPRPYDDTHLRETANPFPHSSYSAPPPGWD